MQINSVAAQSLQDAEVYLREIDPDVYGMSLDLLFGASIGQHTRHFVEFYQCLLDQISGTLPEVNYAKRLREPAIEDDPEFALKTIERLVDKVLALDENVTCKLKCSEQFENEDVYIDSNLERELLYNIEHTIHHLAIIKIGLAAVAPGIGLPEHFGVAPSTLRYRDGICAQ
ncbi:MAG: hypothetical protein DRI69_09985 [Bacteroidetes bacterium]|nr:MAG: hypothetical protein DRI69_09985 [Bacteroidota bacterium]